MYVKYERCEQKGCYVKENKEQGVISNRQRWCELSVSQLLSQNKANCFLSAFDKENSIEFPLDSIYYLYMNSNPNLVLMSYAFL